MKYVFVDGLGFTPGDVLEFLPTFYEPVKPPKVHPRHSERVRHFDRHRLEWHTLAAGESFATFGRGTFNLRGDKLFFRWFETGTERFLGDFETQEEAREYADECSETLYLLFNECEDLATFAEAVDFEFAGLQVIRTGDWAPLGVNTYRFYKSLREAETLQVIYVPTDNSVRHYVQVICWPTGNDDGSYWVTALHVIREDSVAWIPPKRHTSIVDPVLRFSSFEPIRWDEEESQGPEKADSRQRDFEEESQGPAAEMIQLPEKVNSRQRDSKAEFYPFSEVDGFDEPAQSALTIEEWTPRHVTWAWADHPLIVSPFGRGFWYGWGSLFDGALFYRHFSSPNEDYQYNECESYDLETEVKACGSALSKRVVESTRGEAATRSALAGLVNAVRLAVGPAILSGKRWFTATHAHIEADVAVIHLSNHDVDRSIELRIWTHKQHVHAWAVELKNNGHTLHGWFKARIPKDQLAKLQKIKFVKPPLGDIAARVDRSKSLTLSTETEPLKWAEFGRVSVAPFGAGYWYTTDGDRLFYQSLVKMPHTVERWCKLPGSKDDISRLRRCADVLARSKAEPGEEIDKGLLTTLQLEFEQLWLGDYRFRLKKLRMEAGSLVLTYRQGFPEAGKPEDFVEIRILDPQDEVKDWWVIEYRGDKIRWGRIDLALRKSLYLQTNLKLEENPLEVLQAQVKAREEQENSNPIFHWLIKLPSVEERDMFWLLTRGRELETHDLRRVYQLVRGMWHGLTNGWNDLKTGNLTDQYDYPVWLETQIKSYFEWGGGSVQSGIPPLPRSYPAAEHEKLIAGVVDIFVQSQGEETRQAEEFVRRRERVERVRNTNHLSEYGETETAVLEALLDKFSDGHDDLKDLGWLQVPPISNSATVKEVLEAFGGKAKYEQAIRDLELALNDQAEPDQVEGEEQDEEPDPSDHDEPAEEPDPSDHDEPAEEPDPSDHDEPAEEPDPSDHDEPAEEPVGGEEQAEEPVGGEEQDEEPDPPDRDEPAEEQAEEPVGGEDEDEPAEEPVGEQAEEPVGGEEQDGEPLGERPATLAEAEALLSIERINRKYGLSLPDDDIARTIAREIAQDVDTQQSFLANDLPIFRVHYFDKKLDDVVFDKFQSSKKFVTEYFEEADLKKEVAELVFAYVVYSLTPPPGQSTEYRPVEEWYRPRVQTVPVKRLTFTLQSFRPTDRRPVVVDGMCYFGFSVLHAYRGLIFAGGSFVGVYDKKLGNEDGVVADLYRWLSIQAIPDKNANSIDLAGSRWVSLFPELVFHHDRMKKRVRAKLTGRYWRERDTAVIEYRIDQAHSMQARVSPTNDYVDYFFVFFERGMPAFQTYVEESHFRRLKQNIKMPLFKPVFPGSGDLRKTVDLRERVVEAVQPANSQLQVGDVGAPDTIVNQKRIVFGRSQFFYMFAFYGRGFFESSPSINNEIRFWRFHGAGSFLPPKTLPNVVSDPDSAKRQIVQYINLLNKVKTKRQTAQLSYLIEKYLSHFPTIEFDQICFRPLVQWFELDTACLKYKGQFEGEQVHLLYVRLTLPSTADPNVGVVWTVHDRSRYILMMRTSAPLADLGKHKIELEPFSIGSLPDQSWYKVAPEGIFKEGSVVDLPTSIKRKLKFSRDMTIEFGSGKFTWEQKTGEIFFEQKPKRTRLTLGKDLEQAKTIISEYMHAIDRETDFPYLRTTAHKYRRIVGNEISFTRANETSKLTQTAARREADTLVYEYQGEGVSLVIRVTSEGRGSIAVRVREQYEDPQKLASERYYKLIIPINSLKNFKNLSARYLMTRADEKSEAVERTWYEWAPKWAESTSTYTLEDRKPRIEELEDYRREARFGSGRFELDNRLSQVNFRQIIEGKEKLHLLETDVTSENEGKKVMERFAASLQTTKRPDLNAIAERWLAAVGNEKLILHHSYSRRRNILKLRSILREADTVAILYSTKKTSLEIRLTPSSKPGWVDLRARFDSHNYELRILAAKFWMFKRYVRFERYTANNGIFFNPRDR